MVPCVEGKKKKRRRIPVTIKSILYRSEYLAHDICITRSWFVYGRTFDHDGSYPKVDVIKSRRELFDKKD